MFKLNVTNDSFGLHSRKLFRGALILVLFNPSMFICSCLISASSTHWLLLLFGIYRGVTTSPRLIYLNLLIIQSISESHAICILVSAYLWWCFEIVGLLCWITYKWIQHIYTLLTGFIFFLLTLCKILFNIFELSGKIFQNHFGRKMFLHLRVK